MFTQTEIQGPSAGAVSKTAQQGNSMPRLYDDCCWDHNIDLRRLFHSIFKPSGAQEKSAAGHPGAAGLIGVQHPTK